MKTTAYKNKYNSSHYDRINLIVPKGEKDRLKQLAAAQGISLNEYICRLILKQENDMLDRMQIAEKYRKMILTITGSTKEGYTIQLKKSTSIQRLAWILSSAEPNQTFGKTSKNVLRKISEKVLLSCFYLVTNSEFLRCF